MRQSHLKKQILTIPNLLSLIRLALIPVIVWLYCVEKSPAWTAAVIVLSGVTDVVDGWIARHFNMVSDVGKALDPVADKLTQMAVLICLVTRFPWILLPLCLMVVKELSAIVLRGLILKKTGEVQSAVWHGKVNTFLLDAVMLLHILWYRIPATVSYICIGICTGMMILSCILYTLENLRFLRDSKNRVS